MTSKIFVLPLVVAVLSVCAVMPARSASIKNFDTVDHKVVVVEGRVRHEHLLLGQQEVSNVCTNVCSVYIGDDSEPYEVRAADKTEIEGGQLFYLEEAPQSEAPKQ